MILTDYIHLISTESAEELHRFAKKIGLRREWFQPHIRHPHYDLTTNRKSNMALKKGAVMVSPKEIVLRNFASTESGASHGRRD